jgi:hypothetical protein
MLAQNIEIAGRTIDVLKEETNYWLIAIWTMYLIMTSIFLFRFVRNIIKLNVKTKSNTATSYRSTIDSIKRENIALHFLNTIFINQEIITIEK